MASFAQLDENNKVLNIIKIDDSLDGEGNESEALGIAKCQSLFGSGTTWKQTWFGENPQRHRAAVVGGFYDETNNVYTELKPYPSWVLNTTTYQWEPPTAQPEFIVSEPKEWKWDESSTSWVKVDVPEPSESPGGTWSWDTTVGAWVWTEDTPE